MKNQLAEMAIKILSGLRSPSPTQEEKDNWKKQNRIAKISAYGALLSAIVSFLAVAISVCAAKIAYETYVAANRPWLEVTPSLNGPVTFSDWDGQDGIFIGLQLNIKNFGNTPATNVVAVGPIVVHPGNVNRIKLDVPQREACEQARKTAAANPIGGIPAFPNTPTKIEYGTGIDGVYKPDEAILFAVTGCVDYTWGPALHSQTGFRMIFGYSGGGLVLGIPFPKDPKGAGWQKVIPYPGEKPSFPGLIYVKEMPPDQFVFRPEDSGNYAR